MLLWRIYAGKIKLLQKIIGQIFFLDRPRGRHIESALEHVAQLAHVARPVVHGEDPPHFLVNAGDGPVHALIEIIDIVVGHVGNIFLAFAQGLDIYSHGAESVKEVAPQLAVFDTVDGVLVEGGKEPGGVFGAGIGALDRAEEDALQQGLGDGGAVLGDEAVVAPDAQAVQRLTSMTPTAQPSTSRRRFAHLLVSRSPRSNRSSSRREACALALQNSPQKTTRAASQFSELSAWPPRCRRSHVAAR